MESPGGDHILKPVAHFHCRYYGVGRLPGKAGQKAGVADGGFGVLGAGGDDRYVVQLSVSGGGVKAANAAEQICER